LSATAEFLVFFLERDVKPTHALILYDGCLPFRAYDKTERGIRRLQTFASQLTAQNCYCWHYFTFV